MWNCNCKRTHTNFDICCGRFMFFLFAKCTRTLDDHLFLRLSFMIHELYFELRVAQYKPSSAVKLPLMCNTHCVLLWICRLSSVPPRFILNSSILPDFDLIWFDIYYKPLNVLRQHNRRSLRVAYHSVFRKIFGYQYLESVTNLPHSLERLTWEELIRKRQTGFMKRVRNCDNSSLVKLLSNSYGLGFLLCFFIFNWNLIIIVDSFLAYLSHLLHLSV